MMPDFVGSRIKALRQERKLSQGDLARLFGFKDHQTVSAIETGKRHVSAEELLVAVDKLGASLDYFTDPFRLVGAGKFSWRRSNAAIERVNAAERRAERWIAAYRTLAPQVGRPPSYLRPALRLASQSRFEDAMEAGERFAADFAIGALPAEYLADIMERKLGMLVLMVDRIEGVSAAACRLPDLDAVLINRHEARGRRHLDLAHELFHLLTWDAMPPDHVEEASESKSRVEQFANTFACAVAMPAAAIDRFGPWDGDLVARLNTAADALHVTAMALKWRLIALGRLDPSAARAIPDHALRDGAEGLEGEPPPLFSRPFIEVIARAIDARHVSARQAADLLDMSVDNLADLRVTYGLETHSIREGGWRVSGSE